MNVNFEYYKVFYHVCACGSLTAAAQELCISQPAVSQAVRQLEKEAGTKLFFRTSKGVQLTREGGASVPLCKAWSGGAAGRREDAGADAEYGCGGSADWRQRYDAAVLSSSLSGTVSPGIS